MNLAIANLQMNLEQKNVVQHAVRILLEMNLKPFLFKTTTWQRTWSTYAKEERSRKILEEVLCAMV